MIASRRTVFKSGELELVGDQWGPLPGDTRHRGHVLLLHGGAQTRQSWRGTGATLSRSGWTVTATDARGHGDSNWDPAGDYTTDAQIGDLHAIVEQLGGRPVVVGASMGGLTALIAEGENPGLISALVLVDVTPKLERAGIHRILSFMTSRPDGFASLTEAAEVVQSYSLRKRPLNPEGLRKNLRQRSDGRWAWHWDPAFPAGLTDESLLNARETRAREAARAVRVPTLLVRGAESDVVSRASTADLLAQIPSAAVVDVPGTGHMLTGDANDVFGRHVASFLESHEMVVKR